MTYDRFKHLICLLSQNRTYINSVFQVFDKTKKTDDFIVVVVTDTSSVEFNILNKEGYGFSVFSAETYGAIELWIYDRDYETYENSNH